MGCLEGSKDGADVKGSAERSLDDCKEIRASFVGDGHGLSEESESKINEVVVDRRELVIRDESSLQRQLQSPLAPPPPPPPSYKPVPPSPPQLYPQQQSSTAPGSIIRWERFLPMRSLKVLLVENDDSTRQVVTALLRNCSYGVTTAANGLQAWKILGDLTSQIDLVLTEVVMPSLSGIGLLCKIMNHKTYRNIPVIMMSSHDSMGIVFSCLSKGAVDFLVKPIRKNELKNLWQHVWRRCHSSSGSGSESGIHSQKSTKLKSGEESDNNTGSNDEDDNASNTRDESDNGSGTQSSWTKRAVEVDSPQPKSPYCQFSDTHDSTCAQVVHTKPKILGQEWVLPMTKESQELLKQHRDVEMGKDLEIGVPRTSDVQPASYPKSIASFNLTVMDMDNFLSRNQTDPNEGPVNLVNNGPCHELRKQADDLIGGANETTESICKMSEIGEKVTPDSKELPSLELSLKRLRSVVDDCTGVDDRNILRHSSVSAFSRYNTSGTAAQTPTGFGGSNSLQLDDNTEAIKIESTYSLPFNFSFTPLNQSCNGSSKNNDMASTTNNAFTGSMSLKDQSESTSAANCMHSTMFQPEQKCLGGPSQHVMTQKMVDVAVPAMVQPSGNNCQVQVQHHCHHYYHHHYHIHNIQKQEHQQLQEQVQQSPMDHDDLPLKTMTHDVPQCKSSNLIGGAMDGNEGNFSLNGSVSGSNYGSNGNNGGNNALNLEEMNMDGDTGMVGTSDTAGGRSGSRSGADQNWTAQRVAALMKFRQKRKERCFEKKVRYQSRKRLAEQRPRVRGQFVRHVHENINRNDGS